MKGAEGYLLQGVFKRVFKGDLKGHLDKDMKGDLLSSSGQVQVRSGPGLV